MCRSLLAPWYNEQGEKQYLGRSNTGVVSINFPRIAMESNGDKALFFKILKERIELAKDVVKWRYDRLITLKAKEAEFTYVGGVFGLNLDPEESVERVFAAGRGSLSLGYIGCYETALVMTGEDPVFSEKAFNFQKEIMEVFNDQVEVYKSTVHKGISIYSSPSESLTHRFCQLDLTRFGKVKGVTDKGFYVNSFHVNTEAQITPFEKIDFESKFQPLAKGGHVSFVEMNNLSGNLGAYESVVRYAHDKKLMYIGINSPWDFCKTCHWTGELKLELDTDYHYFCPSCGELDKNKIVKTVRLCGYLSTANKRPPVVGRIKEIRSRVKHG